MHAFRSTLAGSLVLMLALSMSACSDGGKLGNVGRFSQALREQLAAQQPTDKPTEVDLAQVGKLRWDSLYIFDAGTQQADNCTLLGLGFLECQLSMPRVVKTGEAVLVFVRDGQVTHAERHALAHGDFGPPTATGAAGTTGATTRPQPVLRTSARFSVMAVGGGSSGNATSGGAVYGNVATGGAATPTGWRLHHKAP